MTLENLAWKKEFFWDGRAKSLREQVLQPIQNPAEMHETLTNVVDKLSASRDLAFLPVNCGAIPDGLLESQLATLEVPSDAWSIAVDGPPEEAVQQILARMREAGLLTAGAGK